MWREGLAVALVLPTPAFAGSSDCCVPNESPGCDDAQCEMIVCAIDPFCCDLEWDAICAGQALELCAACPQQGDCLACDDTEGEPCGEAVNDGGCGGDAFGTVACGETVCGNAWALAGTRDVDWYLIDLGVPGTLTATMSSEFNGVCFIVDGLDVCQPFIVGDTGTASGCKTFSSAGATLEPRTYAVFVATAEFDGVPCGGANDYEVSVMCRLDCVADVDGDEVVGVDDIVEVILAWGDCEGPCAADVTGDGNVGVGDLVQVIVAWGPCP